MDRRYRKAGIVSDERPDPVATLDQMLAGLTMRARVIRHYYLSLLQAGFDEAQALELARDYQRGLGS
jgi:hypothetical protein